MNISIQDRIGEEKPEHYPVTSSTTAFLFLNLQEPFLANSSFINDTGTRSLETICTNKQQNAMKITTDWIEENLLTYVVAKELL